MPTWSSRLLSGHSGNASSNSSRNNPHTHNNELDRAPLEYFPDFLAPPPHVGQSGSPSPPPGSQQRNGSSSPRRHRPHARSVSDKIPAILGGGKRRPDQPTGQEQLHDSIAVGEAAGQKSKQGKGKSPEDTDVEVGHCATCGTRVRWPKGVTEYRCTTCAMVNDLQPQKPRAARDPNSNQPSRAGTYPGVGPHARPVPLTVDRTRVMIDRCIDSYLELLRSGGPSKATYAPPRIADLQQTISPPIETATKFNSNNPFFKNAVQGSGEVSYSSSPPPESPTSSRPPPRPIPHSNAPTAPPIGKSPPTGFIPRKPLPGQGDSLPNRPLRQPPPPPIKMPPQMPPIDAGGSISTSAPNVDSRVVKTLDEGEGFENKAIFKPLEEYITKSYGDLECLTHAFSSTRPRAQRSQRSDERLLHRNLDITQPTPSAHQHSPLTSHIPGSSMPEADFTELDAKMLLLGDFAENGAWWTGREENPAIVRRATQDAQTDGVRRLVNPKSPLINWAEASRWYKIVISAGSSWRDRLKDPSKVSDENELNTSFSEVDKAFVDARLHLQRTLLKATESLLKRPGKLLKEPSDARFLLIMLANPMIYPNFNPLPAPEPSAGTGSTLRPPAALTRRPSDGGASPGSYNVWEKGHAFALIKRILGLMANLNNECHRHLIAWFSRYDEEKLHSILDLIQRFFTQRIKRQHGRTKSNPTNNPTMGLIPNLTGTQADTSAQLHAALGLGPQTKGTPDSRGQLPSYTDDWQVKTTAKVMQLIFIANKNFYGRRSAKSLAADAKMARPGSLSRTYIKNYGQPLSTSEFYNSMVDFSDLVLDFDIWESTPSSFAFCQFPFLLSVGAKIKIMEHDARRQMEVRAREAFFNSILKNKALEQYLLLKVRRDCLVEDSLKGISSVVGSQQEDIKKKLKIQFVHEEGIDAGGLKKEWFLLLTREIFDPRNDMFLYDEESRFCYFNPHSFEPSDQFFLVGALLGLAIYNSIILDVALPPFTFKKLLLSGHAINSQKASHPRPHLTYTLEDLAEYRPSLARGLRQLLEYEGDVQSVFCRDFVIEVERYGQMSEIPLCLDGANRPVTNNNRAEFVDLYVRYILDTLVTRQFEPFKRGFFTVCGGNALSLFQPEEIELLVRGSDEPLDVPALKAVAVYDNWKTGQARYENPSQEVPLVQWFWEFFENATPPDQRRILGFITGSDRVPAMGAANIIIKLSNAGPERNRFPIARTCFNQLLLFEYASRSEMEEKLWRAVTESEGFGLK